MGYHVPEEETLDPELLARLQREKLAVVLAEVARSNRFYQDKLKGLSFNPADDPLSRFPLTTRAEIQRDQIDHPPYGTVLTYSPVQYTRLHQTSGTTGTPLRWLDTSESWAWWKRCWSIVLRGAGVTEEDRVMVPFSFGPFVGFWSAFEAATSLGALTLAAGGMTTSARLGYLLDNEVTVLCCTPTYASRMLEAAADEGLDMVSSAVRLLIVGGEPGGSIPSVRSRLESGWGARVFDHVGMTEVGAWGFECEEHPGGVHVIESEFIPEIINPDTAQPVEDGQRGELVLTNLGRLGSPMIRYRTGDLVQLARRKCSCGRFFARLDGGVLGRRDDMLVIRGNNVFPSAIEDILREISDVAEFRLEVEQGAALADLRIHVEPSKDGDRFTLAARVEQAIRDRLHFRPRVVLVEPGSLPRFELKSRRVIRSGKAQL